MEVWPKDDVMRKHLKHPSGNIGFHEGGSGQWPDDSFTHRRLADGDILPHDPSPPVEEKKPTPVAEEPKPAAPPKAPDPPKPLGGLKKSSK